MPNAEKYRALTRWPSSRSGSFAPVIVGCQDLKTAIALNDRARAASS
jgi:hypothetical protein